MASNLAVEEKEIPGALLKRLTSSVNATLNSALLLSSIKKLKRMPHLFDRVLELPFHADTVVEFRESRHSFTFVVRRPGLIAEEVKAELVEIVPGATKVVIIGGGQDLLSDLESSSSSQLELWRFRLPASTVPEDTVVRYENEVLQVTIPKNPVTCAEWIFNKKDNDAADAIYLPFHESKADTRQQCFLDECTENPVTVLRAINGFDSSSDIEDKSTRTGHNTEQELQFQQRTLSNDLESFGSPQHARKRSSCTKAARQQEGGGGESPHFLHDLGSWVHNFAIFV
jgi:hypothetical protein